MAAAAVVAVVVAVIAAEVAAKVAVKVVVVLRVAVVVGGGGGWWWMVNVKVKTATATATATAHKQLKKNFLQAAHRPDVPQHGAPRRGEGFGGGYPPPKRNMCARVCGCLACVCCGCVCGSGVRQAHAPFVETGCSHCLAYARPRRGLGSREGTPSLMLLHQRACEISRSRASFTKVYRPKVIDQPRG